MTNTFTESNFKTEVLENSQPVMVDFWVSWCGPCRMLGPVVEVVAQEQADKIKVGKVNVDENRTLSAQYGIQSIPTVLFFKNGQEVQRVVGVQSKAYLEQIINCDDSAPISSMSAPAMICRRACSTARAVSFATPSPENESGVRLTIPMISGRLSEKENLPQHNMPNLIQKKKTGKPPFP